MAVSQYDSSVMGDTIFSSGKADSAVVRIHEQKKQLLLPQIAIQFIVKRTQNLAQKISVAESWRNLIASGAEPIAITDNLNFGNPRKLILCMR